uniref:Uncharacterized protein n=1 Tax=Picea glauca TaxID=3330 RepID=A0A117NFX7_PICGL|nr:hypothetical protein ABT39_MTgene2026 [Picea glauca]
MSLVYPCPSLKICYVTYGTNQISPTAGFPHKLMVTNRSCNLNQNFQLKDQTRREARPPACYQASLLPATKLRYC